MSKENTGSNKQLQQAKPTVGERFTNMIVREYGTTAGMLTEFGERERRLAQHLFVKIDSDLKALEAKRQDKNPNAAPIVWENINMNKLALDAVHRIELGIDALVPNHLHTIAYYNKRTKKYDLDLRIGYKGKDFYRRKIAMDPPVDVIYELVHETDKFKPLKRSVNRAVEAYEFEIREPFNRGEVIGGFGYIMYEDPRKNTLVIVTNEDFQKSRKAAMSDVFWRDHPTEMKLKTLVNRVTDKLRIDPDKIKTAAVCNAESDTVEVQAEIDENANSEPLDIEPEQAEEPGQEETSKQNTRTEEPDHAYYEDGPDLWDDTPEAQVEEAPKGKAKPSSKAPDYPQDTDKIPDPF